MGSLRLVPALRPESAAGDSLFFDDGSISRVCWFGWRLVAAEQELQYDTAGQATARVDLLGCNQPAMVLGALVLLTSHRFAPDTNAAVAGLLAALDDVLDLQVNLCSGNKPALSEQQIREAICQFVRRFNDGERP